MKTPLLKDRVLLGLVLLAVAQVVVLTFVLGDVPPGRRLALGDNVSDIVLQDATGHQGSLASGEPTLLLVFHSECAYCLQIAPTWRAWLEAHDLAVRVLAVSSEPVETGAAYAAEHGWPVEVGRIVYEQLGSPGHALTSRTPWLFLIDGDGTILAEGHGNGLAEMGQTVERRFGAGPEGTKATDATEAEGLDAGAPAASATEKAPA